MKIKLSLIALLAMFVFSGCSDDESPYKCSDCVNTPEANAANDDSGKGIYKGVLIGSSGTIKFDIDNAGGGSYTAILNIGNDEIELTSSGTFNENGFEGCFVNANEGVSICFTVSSNGQEWEITEIVIPGHSNLLFTLFKEYSDQLVEVYEGTYSGDDSGTFNMVLLRDAENNENGQWSAISRGDQDNYYGGYMEDEDLVGEGGEVLVFGELEGDVVEGDWITFSDDSGTWKGKRTL